MRGDGRYGGISLVFTGGAVGALTRYLIDTTASRFDGIALDIFVINVVGAFLLALAVGYITGAGEPTRNQLRFRLFFGTGVMGGFTTYSTLANETAHLFVGGRMTAALTYALGTIVVGAAASVVGLFVGRRAAQIRSLDRVDEEGAA